MKAELGRIMQQAQALQEKLKQAQEEIAALVVTGESGGGMVKVTMTGKYEATRVDLEPDLLKEDPDMLADLIAAAVNDATRRVREASSEKMAEMGGGLSLPPGFSLPF